MARMLLLLAGLMLAYIAKAQLQAYNNYDFVPGEKILFEDNLQDSRDGELPPRWNLVSGQGVVNNVKGSEAIVLTDGNYAIVTPAIKTKNYLSQSFTIELDYYAPGEQNGVVVFLFTSDPDDTKTIGFQETGNVATNAFPNDLSANYPGAFDNTAWHHISIAYNNQQIKCYVDQYRVLVIPKCGFTPLSIGIGGIAPLTFKNAKLAEGGGMNMLGKILTDGKIVTHAIKFDVNRWNIKPESMGFLNEMAAWLKQNPAIKLEVDGYTDSDGNADANLKLSQQRADAVSKQLVSMGIDASRLVARGFGANKPISDNATPEGKANNRRVEFVKL